MPREKDPAAAPAKRAPRRRTPVPQASPEAGYQEFIDPQYRSSLISRAAYFRAMHRGFAPGHELSDWLAAEAEVDAELLSGTASSRSA